MGKHKIKVAKYTLWLQVDYDGNSDCFALKERDCNNEDMETIRTWEINDSGALVITSLEDGCRNIIPKGNWIGLAEEWELRTRKYTWDNGYTIVPTDRDGNFVKGDSDG